MVATGNQFTTKINGIFRIDWGPHTVCRYGMGSSIETIIFFPFTNRIYKTIDTSFVGVQIFVRDMNIMESCFFLQFCVSRIKLGAKLHVVSSILNTIFEYKRIAGGGCGSGTRKKTSSVSFGNITETKQPVVLLVINHLLIFPLRMLFFSQER